MPTTSLKIVNRRNQAICTLDVAGDTVDDLQREFHERYKLMYPARQRFTAADKTPLQPGHQLKEFGVADGDTLTFKDLGPQVAWRTVFLVEYFGPALIHLTFYALFAERNSVQTLAVLMTLLHYIKRELETLFVHRFSHGTMPIRNIFKNSFYYWIVGGLFLCIGLYTSAALPLVHSQTKKRDLNWVDIVLLGFWLSAQAANFFSHWQLRQLRPPGTRVRKIPRGFAFEYVSCPNYLFEIIGWLLFSLITMERAAFVFTFLGGLQMWRWAVKKHANYRKEFKDYPRNRRVLLPFLL